MKKMSKLLAGLLGGCVLLSLLTGALCLAPKAEEGAAGEDLTVTDESVADVSGVVLKNAKGSVGLLLHPEGIEVVDAPQNAQFDGNKLSALVYHFCHLTAQRMLPAPLGPEEYGLDAPAAQLTVLLISGEKVRLSLGIQNPLDGTWYLQREGREQVCLVDDASGEMLLQSMDDLRLLELVPALTDATLETLTSIEVDRPGGEGYTVLRQSGEGTLYSLSRPVEATLDWQTVFDKVLTPLSQLSGERFVSDDKPLSDFGLDQPARTLTLTMDGGTYQCVFAPGDGDFWYAAALPDGLVCQVSAGQMDFLDLNYLDLLGGSLYSRSLADVSRLSVSAAGTAETVEVSGSGESISGTTRDGRILDNRAITAFYGAVTDLPIAGELEEGASPDPKALLTMTLTLRDGGADILEFLPLDDRRCTVSVNGQADFTTYRTVVEDILQRFRQLSGE